MFEETAQRELFEETGYTGKAVKVTEGLAAQEPSVMFNLCKFVQMEIDGNLPANKSPKQNLPADEMETIEVKLIPLKGLGEFLNSWALSGRYVQADLFAFALGLELQLDS